MAGGIGWVAGRGWLTSLGLVCCGLSFGGRSKFGQGSGCVFFRVWFSLEFVWVQFSLVSLGFIERYRNYEVSVQL